MYNECLLCGKPIIVSRKLYCSACYATWRLDIEKNRPLWLTELEKMEKAKRYRDKKTAGEIHISNKFDITKSDIPDSYKIVPNDSYWDED